MTNVTNASIFNQSPHTLFSQQVEVISHHRLFVDNLIQEGAELHDILNRLHAASELDTLEIRITSGGGIVNHGQQLINVMMDKFYDRCVTIIDSEAASMAAVLFMAASERVIYPHSIMMVHDISMHIGGKASETRRMVETCQPAFVNYFNNIFKDTMTIKEIKKMFDGKDYWFDAEQMCKRGMATVVIVDGENKSAARYLEMLEENRALAKKARKQSKKKKKGK